MKRMKERVGRISLKSETETKKSSRNRTKLEFKMKEEKNDYLKVITLIKINLIVIIITHNKC